MFCPNSDHDVPSTCYKRFNDYAVPRDDNSILRDPAVVLREKTTCTFVFIKQLIIRLRRRQDKEDFLMFDSLIERYADLTIDVMNARWLVSVLDTYTDMGDAVESRNALLATCIANCEKMFKTKDMCFTMTPREFEGAERVAFASGLDTFILPNADMPRNFFRRLSSALRTTPIIHRIFKRLMKLLLEGDSACHFLADKAAPSAFKNPYLELLVGEEL